MKAICLSIDRGAGTFAQGRDEFHANSDAALPRDRVQELFMNAAPSRVCMKMAKDQIWRVQIEDAPVSLRVLSGAVWITEDGQFADHIIKAAPSLGPAEFMLARTGGATVSALVEATVELG